MSDQEFNPNDAAELREFDNALHSALAAAREWYRHDKFIPDHPKLWLVIAEHGDAEHEQIRLRVLKSKPVTVRITFIGSDGAARSVAVDGLPLMRRVRKER
jgi:hypothetical protein